MYLLGEKQILTVTRVGEIGCYLGDHYDSRAQDVLLPAKWMPNGAQIAPRPEFAVVTKKSDCCVCVRLSGMLEMP